MRHTLNIELITLLLMLAGWGWLWLSVWLANHGGCLWAFGGLVVLITFIAMNMIENAAQRRQAFTRMYLAPGSWLYQRLRRPRLLFVWQLLKAVALALILLIEALQWQPWTWLLLFVDSLLLFAAWHYLSQGLNNQVRNGLQSALARRLLVPVNALICATAIAWGQYVTGHPDYRDYSLAQAFMHGELSIQLQCHQLALPAAAHAGLNAVGWQLMQKLDSSAYFSEQWLRALVWAVFLFSSALSVWAYSRLLLGMAALARPSWLPRLLR